MKSLQTAGLSCVCSLSKATGVEQDQSVHTKNTRIKFDSLWSSPASKNPDLHYSHRRGGAPDHRTQVWCKWMSSQIEFVKPNRGHCKDRIPGLKQKIKQSRRQTKQNEGRRWTQQTTLYMQESPDWKKKRNVRVRLNRGSQTHTNPFSPPTPNFRQLNKQR